MNWEVYDVENIAIIVGKQFTLTTLKAEIVAKHRRHRHILTLLLLLLLLSTIHIHNAHIIHERNELKNLEHRRWCECVMPWTIAREHTRWHFSAAAAATAKMCNNGKDNCANNNNQTANPKKKKRKISKASNTFDINSVLLREFNCSAYYITRWYHWSCYRNYMK